MCIMEVNLDQHPAVWMQALAHNLATVRGDTELVIEAAPTFHDITPARLESIKRGQDEVRRAYATFLELFGELAEEYGMDPAGHVHTHDHGVVGSERDLTPVEAVVKFTGQAHAYETR